MYKSYNQIFIGFLLTIFHINIGPLQILPPFVGLLIMFFAIYRLYNISQIKDFRISYKLIAVAILLSLIYTIITFSYNILGNFYYYMASILPSIVYLLFIFYLINGSIKLFDNCWERNILLLRVFTVFHLLTLAISVVLISKFAFNILTLTSLLILINYLIVAYLLYFYRKIAKMDMLSE